MLQRLIAFLIALAVGGCAYRLPPLPAAPDLKPWQDAIDWRSAGDEAAGLLSAYLRVDSLNPPGNETRAARFLAAVLARAGIPSEIVEFAPGRSSLIARLQGDGREKPLCLLSHTDVVGAVEKDWPDGKGPLSGTLDADGMIWGRGALDMKGMGAIELMTVVWLKRLGVPLRRDVILLAVGDEEVGSGGMKSLVEKHWGRIGCSHLINEGGMGLKDLFFPGQTVFPITVVEKGALGLRMTVRGEGGHGSTPRPEHTPKVLLQALARIEQRRPDVSVHASYRELAARVGEHHGGLAGFLLQRPALVDGVLLKRLMKNPVMNAAVVDTVAVTGIETGDHSPNVVPTTASAILDCRLRPGRTPEQLIAELRHLTGDDPRIRFDQLYWDSAVESPWQDDPLFQALAAQVVAGRPDAVAGPALSVAFTDSLFARQRGVRAYGFVPFAVSQAEAATMHGPNERISVENLRTGLAILFRSVVQAAADLTRPPVARVAAAPPFTPPTETGTD
jgi:acetylornithine deacetylase/succinyl-diaminopimelate desuccinylase-like protein